MFPGRIAGRSAPTNSRAHGIFTRVEAAVQVAELAGHVRGQLRGAVTADQRPRRVRPMMPRRAARSSGAVPPLTRPEAGERVARMPETGTATDRLRSMRDFLHVRAADARPEHGFREADFPGAQELTR
jgi:hypothetical protein